MVQTRAVVLKESEALARRYMRRFPDSYTLRSHGIIENNHPITAFRGGLFFIFASPDIEFSWKIIVKNGLVKCISL